MNKTYELWSTFRNSGRPNTIIGKYSTYNEALADVLADAPDHSNWGIGETWIDSDGFVQWK